ncbi:MAG TPA: GNAT family N-acetyltransferase [Enhygromyxa sp.]|nr:GNAT family N-acetyltransferase [Enhygromyxa sp.]
MHGWSDDELRDELLIVPRLAFVPWSGTEVIERPGWLQLITPSFRLGGLNEVVYAQLDEHDADAVIDAAIARYRELGLRFRWTVTPECRPADLATRLEQRGFVRIELVAMVREVGELSEHDDPDITVEIVDAASLPECTAVLAEGWATDPTALADYGRAQIEDDRYALFLARHRGQPAAAAGCIAFERSLFLQGGVVLPEFRGRGLYRALVHARLHHAAARGLGLVTVHSDCSTSAPLLERFGFARVVGLVTFRGD